MTEPPPEDPFDPAPSPQRPPAFERFGRAYHLRIQGVEGLRQALELDTARWVASAAPLETFNTDPAFLNHLDDGDGRVRAAEVRAMIRWLLEALEDTEAIERSEDVLELDALRAELEPGATIRQAAERALERLGEPGADRITLAQIQKICAEEQARGLSEAGLVLPEAAQEAAPRALLEDTATRQTVAALIEATHANAVVLDHARQVERLILAQAHILDFVDSFVSFPDLYDPAQHALFEQGTLVVDGRRLTLAILVRDRARHARFSDASNIFTLYVELLDDDGQTWREVAVPVTHGGRGNLLESKWGVFYDLEGRERHARVVQIIDNPISLLEAFMAPFKRLATAVNDRIEKISEGQQQRMLAAGTTRAEAVGKRLEQSTTTPDPSNQAATSSVPTAPAATRSEAAPAAGGATPTAASAAPATSGTAGLVAGGAVAIAALGSTLAFVTNTIEKIGWRTLGLSALALTLAVLVPVLLVAWIRLRRRDLSALLEGSGWAVNARMRLTRAQARAFTYTPPFPSGSTGTPRWHILWGVVILLALAALWFAWSQG